MNATKILISTAAAVMIAGAIGFATAQTNSAGATGGTQSGSTPTSQMPATNPAMQNQQQSPAPGSMTTDSSRSADTSGAGTMNRRADGNMNNGTASTGTMNGGMAGERARRTDRN